MRGCAARALEVGTSFAVTLQYLQDDGSRHLWVKRQPIVLGHYTSSDDLPTILYMGRGLDCREAPKETTGSTDNWRYRWPDILINGNSFARRVGETHVVNGRGEEKFILMYAALSPEVPRGTEIALVNAVCFSKQWYMWQ
jgi:hypothetical protein